MCNFVFGAVAVQGYRIVIGIDDVLCMDCHGKLSTHRARADTVHANTVFSEFARLLLGQMHDRSFRRSITINAVVPGPIDTDMNPDRTDLAEFLEARLPLAR